VGAGVRLGLVVLIIFGEWGEWERRQMRMWVEMRGRRGCRLPGGGHPGVEKRIVPVTTTAYVPQSSPKWSHKTHPQIRPILLPLQQLPQFLFRIIPRFRHLGDSFFIAVVDDTSVYDQASTVSLGRARMPISIYAAWKICGTHVRQEILRQEGNSWMVELTIQPEW